MRSIDAVVVRLRRRRTQIGQSSPSPSTLLPRKSSGPKRSEMRPQWLVRPPSMRARHQLNLRARRRRCTARRRSPSRRRRRRTRRTAASWSTRRGAASRSAGTSIFESFDAYHVGAGLEHHDVRAGLGERVGGHAAAGAGADDADVVHGASPSSSSFPDRRNSSRPTRTDRACRGVVALDERVLYVRAVRGVVGEDLRELDRALADVRHLARRRRRGVLHMHQRHASRILLHVRDRIGAAFHHPVEIHLERHELGICVLHQHVEWQLPAARRFELVIVIVVSEMEARLPRRLARLVEVVGDSLEAARPVALLVRRPCNGDVLMSRGFGVGQGLAPTRSNPLDSRRATTAR